ncbi:sigma factor G inhibitor Gin [Schnuerera sp.]|uniref:sigma factor G inhibitor Gin n=1 Tax=Schnuerera sp. TaxID=2794844 RepID=UPI002B6A6224|nr:sigma factor G inhibitor Gin [Schnuerera sp.]HSH36935.1 sigma factor G inhibitor Gin [Schnuerera sp.]
MNCKLCNKKGKNNIDLLGTNLCKECFKAIATTSISNKDYDYYKEIIKLILKNYMYNKTILNPVK